MPEYALVSQLHCGVNCSGVVIVLLHLCQPTSFGDVDRAMPSTFHPQHNFVEFCDAETQF